jgi:hypothetical protein
MRTGTLSAHLRQRLIVSATALVALMFTILGALIGHGTAGKFMGAGIGAFLGGLVVAWGRKSIAKGWRGRLGIAGSWVLFAVTCGDVGDSVIRELGAPSDVSSFAFLGLAAGFAGGVDAALVEWIALRGAARRILRTWLAFLLTAVSFTLLFRASQAFLGLAVAALLYGFVIDDSPTERR